MPDDLYDPDACYHCRDGYGRHDPLTQACLRRGFESNIYQRKGQNSWVA